MVGRFFKDNQDSYASPEVIAVEIASIRDDPSSTFMSDPAWMRRSGTHKPQDPRDLAQYDHLI